MKFIVFKMWLASIGKKTWIYVACIAGFVALALAGLFVWMHVSGYTLASWLAKFWPTLVVIAVAIVAIVMAVVYLKMRKRK